MGQSLYGGVIKINQYTILNDKDTLYHGTLSYGRSPKISGLILEEEEDMLHTLYYQPNI